MHIVTGWRRLVAAAAFGATWVVAPAALGHSEPSEARIARVQTVTDRWLQVYVDSPAMGREVQADVLLPADRTRPHPMVYLLEGGDNLRSGENDWTAQGGAVEFFADKDVTVVLPIGGAGSFYTDWHNDDPVHGRQKWETLLTRELPALLDSAFNGSGVDAIAGPSMGAHAALALAERSGPLYRAVAAFSGCYQTGDQLGQAATRFIVSSKRGDAEDMWGPSDDADWAAHDVVAHAAALRGKAVYLSAGSGLSGPHETLDTPNLPDVAINGGLLEAVTAQCTRTLQARLQEAGIAATYDYTPQGTHSWPYWVDQLGASWPTLWRALSPPR
ncbi:alpha/beta hydrolase family protein [Nocardia sp. NPDC046473]|uniref:alpha/beta hydrolase n=1 Tax=Nocardia sp. NPDC046473 TaxID=3155733 RepID=UPI0033E2A985